MSARRKMKFFDVLGGLTSSSDARAHHWVAWWNVSRSRLMSSGSSICYSRCAGPVGIKSCRILYDLLD
jgi:hypothetical protein